MCKCVQQFAKTARQTRKFVSHLPALAALICEAAPKFRAELQKEARVEGGWEGGGLGLL